MGVQELRIDLIGCVKNRDSLFVNQLNIAVELVQLTDGEKADAQQQPPEKLEYPINRFTMEVKRQLDVLDRQLAENRFLAGDAYTIADIAAWPWYGALVQGKVYDAAEFLQAHTYKNVIRWAEEIAERPAVQRGRMVKRTWGEPHEQLPERHDASDFKRKTQDKLDAVNTD